MTAAARSNLGAVLGATGRCEEGLAVARPALDVYVMCSHVGGILLDVVISTCSVDEVMQVPEASWKE